MNYPFGTKWVLKPLTGAAKEVILMSHDTHKTVKKVVNEQINKRKQSRNSRACGNCSREHDSGCCDNCSCK